MPAVVQSAAYEPVQSCEAGTKLSLITVAFMFFVVTHSGVSRTDGTLVLEVVSAVLPLTSDFGGVLPARRYRASATAACASR